jgi:PAS domain S-box-containing protein
MISTHWKVPHRPAERKLRILDLLTRQAADFIDRTQTEHRLHRTLEFDQAVMTNMSDGLYTLDTAGLVTSLNPAAAQMFGWTFEELRGRKVHDVIHYKHRNGLAFPVEECESIRVLTPGQPVMNHEDVFIKRDGSFFDVVYSTSPIREGGVITGLVVVFRDVTEQKQAAEILRQRTAQYETLLKEAPIGVFVVDSDFRVRDVNPTARPYFAVLQDLEGRDFVEVLRILRSTDADSVIEIFRNILETGEPFITTERIDNRVKQGESEYFAWHVNRIPLPDGKPGVVCYFQDITLMMRARHEIAESEERYRTLVSVLTDVPWTTSPDGQFVSPQSAWSAYTGQTWEEARGFGWATAIHPADRDQILEIWSEACKTGALYRSQGRVWHALSQTYRYFEARATPLLNSVGAVREWVGTCTDVDERKRAEEELRRANADLEQFAYSASHDLREPIRNIAIYGEILDKRYAHAFDANGQQYLGFITSGAKRMEALLKDLLAYTQSAVAQSDAIGEVDSVDALNKALENLSEAIRESQAELLHDSLPVLHVREVELEQLFQNLIGNAIKYRKDDERPRIRIEARRTAGYWQFSIADNGIGIAPEFQEKAFGLFKRFHNEAKYSGTGIGLAICQKIVSRNGGRIWVESGGIGKGSTFFFTLPASVLQSPGVPSSA